MILVAPYLSPFPSYWKPPYKILISIFGTGGSDGLSLVPDCLIVSKSRGNSIRLTFSDAFPIHS